ncbi:hypothetical protein OGAPHI_003191 [Ogataea philodendri]|uniref:Uncharacterized protein n=1 Tax=Ogataea philodendri TaxID=1378263 RepID=A0A9P8P7H9_9ASCO|nr:uncharacterized protein OGAPHI_003191 [Ogataea philodendri]KAH3666742.1 hypothetical protein OGAPHI_003191 [Ogataea philodendri]
MDEFRRVVVDCGRRSIGDGLRIPEYQRCFCVEFGEPVASEFEISFINDVETVAQTNGRIFTKKVLGVSQANPDVRENFLDVLVEHCRSILGKGADDENGCVFLVFHLFRN